MCQCFNEDLQLLEDLFNEVGLQLKKRRNAPPPLSLAAIHASLLGVFRKYRYTVRDANEMLGMNKCGKCSQHKKRSFAMRTALKCIKSHDIVGAVCYGSDLLRLLLELEAQHEKRIKPMARIAVGTRPMTYDDNFKYRSPVCNEDAVGPNVTIDCWLDVYDSVYKFQLPGDFVANDINSTLHWRPLKCNLYRYNQGMFFGPVTRTTQMVCFAFDNVPITVYKSKHLVFRKDTFTMLNVDVVYDPDTQELKCPDYGKEFEDCRFQIVCQEVAVDTNKTSLSLAASVNIHKTSHGVSVLKIGWIDSEPICNISLSSQPHVRRDRQQRFPYDRWSRYATWHIVMGNNCRIKVRVTSLYGKWPIPCGKNLRWTLVNTDEHSEFDESAYVLQEYYSFQADKGAGIIYPLERTTVNGFFAANIVSSPARLLLLSARLERPSLQGTPISKFTERSTSELIQAMVLKSLIAFRVDNLQYLRLENVSSK